MINPNSHTYKIYYSNGRGNYDAELVIEDGEARVFWFDKHGGDAGERNISLDEAIDLLKSQVKTQKRL